MSIEQIAEDEYIPFGDEWVKEVKKMAKDSIVNHYRDRCLRVKELDSLLSEKESLIIELTNKVVEQEKEIERLKGLIEWAHDFGWGNHRSLSLILSWEKFKLENNL